MSVIVKSLSVGDGDMFYVKHGNDNFTVIDCCMPDEDRTEILKEIKSQAAGSSIVRFISTHPDDDHVLGLDDLDNALNLLNFYCVKNETTKPIQTPGFDKYCELRDDPDKAFYIYRGCSRKWLNTGDEERGSSGISIRWPITGNKHYVAALDDAKKGSGCNNISAIIRWGLNGGATMLWMGDLETSFMEKIEDSITIDAADILFAPHHGRDSGKVPETWLSDMNPKLVIIGEAPSQHLNYYGSYNTITQNSAGDITFECVSGWTHIYVSNPEYSVDFLENKYLGNTFGKYLGSLAV